MKIKRMKVMAADTSKEDYVVHVKNLLAQHDHPGAVPYMKRAKDLFANDPDSETLLPLILSA
jgi:hypothetical protein